MARVRPYLSCDVALSICTTCLRKIEAKISGGEPTAHPDFFAVLAHAKARPIRHLMVNTNGVKIAESDDFAKRLAGRGHHRVRAEAAVRPRRQDDAVRDQIFKLFATNHSPASGAQVDGHDAHAQSRTARRRAPRNRRRRRR